MLDFLSDNQDDAHMPAVRYRTGHRPAEGLGVYTPSKVKQQQQQQVQTYTLPTSGPWAKIALTEIQGKSFKGKYDGKVSFEVNTTDSALDVKFTDGASTVSAKIPLSDGRPSPASNTTNITVGGISYSTTGTKDNLSEEHRQKIKAYLLKAPDLMAAIRDTAAYAYWQLPKEPQFASFLLMLLYIDLSKYYPQDKRVFTQPPNSVTCGKSLPPSGTLLVPYAMFGVSNIVGAHKDKAQDDLDAVPLIDGPPRDCKFAEPTQPVVSSTATASTGGLNISEDKLKLGAAIIGGLFIGYMVFKGK